MGGGFARDIGKNWPRGDEIPYWTSHGPAGWSRRFIPDRLYQAADPSHAAGDADALGLAGHPATERGIQFRAKRDGWEARRRNGRGGGNKYRAASLPADAREALIAQQIGGVVITPAERPAPPRPEDTAALQRIGPAGACLIVGGFGAGCRI